MKEVEVLFELGESVKSASRKLSAFEFKGRQRVVDAYFSDPKRKELKPNSAGKTFESFRLRRKGEECYITYKKDHYKGREWIYSDEFETSIGEFDVGVRIVENLGLKPLVTVDNTKHYFENSKYEIVLEEVVGLGNFVEIEAKRVSDRADVLEVKQALRNILVQHGVVVGQEQNAGKPELLLRADLQQGKRRGK